MMPTMEQADGWVRRAPVMDVEDASRALWEAGWRLTAALSPSGPNLQAFHFSSWLDVACSLLKAQGKRIILTDYPAQDVPWHVLGMQLTAAACLGNVGAMCGELLKWCHANGVPLVEAMEGL